MDGDFFILSNQAVPVVIRQHHRMLPNGRFEVAVLALGSDGMMYNNVSLFTPEDYIDAEKRKKIIQDAAAKLLEAMRANITPENFRKTMELQAQEARRLAAARGEQPPASGEADANSQDSGPAA